MNTRLYRSRYDRMFAGVCGGLGQYLQIDPVWIRLAFVLVTLAGGSGILIYIIMMIVIPENPDEVPHTGTNLTVADPTSDQPTDQPVLDPQQMRTRNTLFVGGILVVVGIFLLLGRLNVFGWVRWELLFPALLIIGGGLLLMRNLRGGN